ncbi:MAG: hypothetical protein ING71_16715 [Rhodocyclaceae bacterium]|nr:hypothetical protein [Rhodocyclaceae bacterium]
MMLVTYLGDNPTIWRGVAFEPRLAVSVSDPDMVAKAADNPWFEVSSGNVKPPVEVDAADVRAMAAELGIKIDRRWGVERIQKAIDEALEG